MDENLNSPSQKNQNPEMLTTSPQKKKLNKRFVSEIIGVVLIVLLAVSSIGSVSQEDYNELQTKYDDLADDYSNLQNRLKDTEFKLETTSTSLDSVTAEYTAFQEKMRPFADLSDEEINTIVTEMEEKAAEEEAARLQAEQAAAQQEAQAAIEAQAAAQPQQPQGEMVWIPQTGSKYHSNSSCSGMKNPTQVTISEAQNRGYEACKKCY